MKHTLNAWNVIKLLLLISAALIEPVTHFVQAKNRTEQPTQFIEQSKE